MFKRSICITYAALLFAAFVCAQESPDGHWESVNTPIGITLDLTKNAKSEWVASIGMSIPTQNGRGPRAMTGMPVQRVTVNGTNVSFVLGEVEPMTSKFNLTLGAGGTMKGTITSQQGPPESVEFKRTGEAKWVAPNPDDPQRWLGKAMAEAESNQPEEALKSFDKLIELMPNDGSNWVGRGQMLEELKRDDEALKAFDKAITLSPWHDGAWNNRGGVLLRFGKYDEAIKSYDKAIELAPRWADSFYHRACAYAGKGDKTNALTDLKKAIELQPSLKAEAVKEVGFKNLHNDPDFKRLAVIAMNPFVGTWKQNVPKSRPYQNPPKSDIATNTIIENGLKIVRDEIAADGKKTHEEQVMLFDGKEYPSVPFPGATQTCSRIDDYGFICVIKSGGQEMMKLYDLISSDGSTGTVIFMFRNSPGKEGVQTFVYEKQ
jgi:hypothetical protein